MAEKHRGQRPAAGGKGGGRPPGRGGSASKGAAGGGRRDGGGRSAGPRSGTGKPSRDSGGGRSSFDRGRSSTTVRGPVPASAEAEPRIDEDVTGQELERFVLAELRTLPEGKAERAAQHLVMVARLMHSQPERALRHARAARDIAPRVGLLRETLGLTAYQAGQFDVALTELKAARRINGSVDFIAMMADCERGLGNPQRALDLISEVQGRLPSDVAVELLIVEAGARRDLGDPEAAVLTLQRKELKASGPHEWLPRLRFAYADALAVAGRAAEAASWFRLAAEVDPEGVTAARERLAEVSGSEAPPMPIDVVDTTDVDEYADGDGEPEDGVGGSPPGVEE